MGIIPSRYVGGVVIGTGIEENTVDGYATVTLTVQEKKKPEPLKKKAAWKIVLKDGTVFHNANYQCINTHNGWLRTSGDNNIQVPVYGRRWYGKKYIKDTNYLCLFAVRLEDVRSWQVCEIPEKKKRNKCQKQR